MSADQKYLLFLESENEILKELTWRKFIQKLDLSFEKMNLLP